MTFGMRHFFSRFKVTKIFDRILLRPIASIGFIFLMVSCRQQMAHQAKQTPLSPSDFFTDGTSARPLVPGTLPQDAYPRDKPFASENQQSGIANVFPYPLTADILVRGRERFEIYCSVCHGFAGEGDGMIVQRGFPAPPSFFIDRLRLAPAEYFFNVITQGKGLMYSYGDRVSPSDRWAIIAYIRALQLSRSLRFEDLTEEERAQLPPLNQGGKP